MSETQKPQPPLPTSCERCSVPGTPTNYLEYDYPVTPDSFRDAGHDEISVCDDCAEYLDDEAERQEIHISYRYQLDPKAAR